MKNAPERLRSFYKELENYGFQNICDKDNSFKNEFIEGKYELVNSLGQKIVISTSIVCININIIIDDNKTHNIIYHSSMQDVSGMFICLDTLNILSNDTEIFTIFIGK